MITIRRSTPDDPAFRSLVAELDADLLNRYGAKQSEYDVHNTVLAGASVVIAMNQDSPVGCGCFKVVESGTVEIKRMYVQASARRLGVAQQVLGELEQWAKEKKYTKANLETANKQPEAVSLYRKCGYQHIDNYGSYIGDEESICMQKRL